MGAQQTAEESFGIMGRHRGDASMGKRLDHEDDGMNSAQTRTMASIHQSRRLGERPQSSSRHAIQSPVTPARGIENRTCAAKRLSIASNSAQPFFGVAASARKR